MNKIWKVLLPLVLVMALLTAAMPAFAAESPTLIPLGRVSVKNTVYNKKVQSPSVTVYDANGKAVPSNCYAVEISGTPRNAGRYQLTVSAIIGSPYTGTLTKGYHIWRAENPFRIQLGKEDFTRNKEKEQSTSIKVVGVKEKAKLGHWYSSRSKVHINGGKLIIDRGFYGTARISIKSKKTTNYKPTRKWYVLTVKKN